MSMRLPIEQLETFTTDCVIAAGGSGEQAEIFAKALVWSDAIGRATHGVWRLPTYCKRLGLGLIKCPCFPQRESSQAAAVRINGDQGFGHYLGHFAMQEAMTLAERSGCGIALVRNSNHFGAGAYYVNLAAERGMIGVAMSNSMPRMAPHGGFRPVFGTNPLAFAAPLRDAPPILFDMATSAVSGASLIRQAETGELIPAGIAVDATGAPILDPSKVDGGTLLPFGGAKGYGITLMIEILCGVLTGAGIADGVHSMFKDFDNPSNTGHLFMALDIEQLFGREDYDERIAYLCATIRASGPEAALPGERRWAELAHNQVAGVLIDDRMKKTLTDLGIDLKVALPWD